MKKNLGKEKKILSGGWEWVLRNIGKYKNKKKGNVMTIFCKTNTNKGNESHYFPLPVFNTPTKCRLSLIIQTKNMTWYQS